MEQAAPTPSRAQARRAQRKRAPERLQGLQPAGDGAMTAGRAFIFNNYGLASVALPGEAHCLGGRFLVADAGLIDV